MCVCVCGCVCVAQSFTKHFEFNRFKEKNLAWLLSRKDPSAVASGLALFANCFLGVVRGRDSAQRRVHIIFQELGED